MGTVEDVVELMAGLVDGEGVDIGEEGGDGSVWMEEGWGGKYV